MRAPRRDDWHHPEVVCFTQQTPSGFCISFYDMARAPSEMSSARDGQRTSAFFELQKVEWVVTAAGPGVANCWAQVLPPGETAAASPHLGNMPPRAAEACHLR